MKLLFPCQTLAITGILFFVIKNYVIRTATEREEIYVSRQDEQENIMFFYY